MPQMAIARVPAPLRPAGLCYDQIRLMSGIEDRRP
jgi:hypothetical protein